MICRHFSNCLTADAADSTVVQWRTSTRPQWRIPKLNPTGSNKNLQSTDFRRFSLRNFDLGVALWKRKKDASGFLRQRICKGLGLADVERGCRRGDPRAGASSHAAS